MLLGIVFNYGFQSLVLLFFILQELIFSMLLWRNGWLNDSKSDKWLGLLIFLCAMYLAPWMFGHAGWYAHDGYREILFFVPFHQYFLFGPVMFFLTKNLTDENFKFSKNAFLHFLPAGLYFLYAIIIAIFDLLVFDEFYFYADGLDKDLKPWYQITGLSSMVIYAILSLRIYARYRKRILETLSYADSVKLKWLKDFLFALVLIIVFRGIFIVLFPEIGNYGLKWWYYLLFGICSYYMAISAYSSSLKLSVLTPNPWTPAEQETIEEHPDQSGLDEVLEKVNDLFEQNGVYKNPTLSLPQLAQQIGSNSSVLSRAINKGSELNFNDYVNRFRILSVKEAISRGDLSYKTLTGIALDSGFNSKSTFIRSFKKQEGMTPSEYLKTID